MNEMVKDIRSVFSEIIDELEWMDDETRVRAKGKSDSMTTHIAYPDELLDDKKLIDLYQNVIIIKFKSLNFLVKHRQ
jgi:predicted metalloendopeptidase